MELGANYYLGLIRADVPDSIAFPLSLLRDVTIEFNKPRVRKRIKAELIERATELRRQAYQAGATGKQVKEAELIKQ